MKLAWLGSKKFWLLIAVIGAIAAATAILPLELYAEQLRQWLSSLGIWALPAFVVLYTLISVVGFPNIILILIAGGVFGIVKGIISASIADTIGAVVCFILGRTIAREQVEKLIQKNKNWQQVDRALAKKGWKILLLSRLSPIIPSNILNYGFSCTKVGFGQYIGLTWLGMLPVISFYVCLGYFGSSWPSSNHQSLQIGGLILTFITALYTTRLAKKAISIDSE